MTQVVVLPADADDENPIRRLMTTVIRADVTSDLLLQDDMIANVNRNLEFWAADPARCVHLKAVADGQLVGVVLVKDFWNLCSLFVATDSQRRGIGASLVEAAAQECKGRSPKEAIWLNAAVNAVGFYRKLGFTQRQSSQQLPLGFQAMQRSV